MKGPPSLKDVKTNRNIKTVRTLRNEEEGGHVKLHILHTKKRRLLKEKKRWENRLAQIESELAQINKDMDKTKEKLEPKTKNCPEENPEKKLVLEY